MTTRVYPDDIYLEFLFGGDGRWSQEFDEEIADFDAVSPAWDKEVDAVGDFDSETDTDGDLNDAVAAAHDGANGLEITFDNDTVAYGTSTAGAVDRTTGCIPFWIDPNAVGLESTKKITIASMVDGAGASNWYVELYNNAGTFQIRQGYTDDADAAQNSAWANITDAYHSCILMLQRSTGDGNDDGFGYLLVDGALSTSYTNADNDTQDWDAGRFGMVATDSTSFGGSFYMDTIKIDPVGAPFVDKLAVKNGTYGLAVPIMDTTARYVEFTDPTDESVCTFEFWLDPKTIAMATNDDFWLGGALGSGAATWAAVPTMNHDGANYGIRAIAWEDDSGALATAYHAITDAWTHIRLVIQVASAPGADDGYLRLYINDVLKEAITGIDNDGYDVDTIRLGPVGGLDAGTYGIFYMDDCKWMPHAWLDRWEDVIGQGKLKASYGIKGFLPGQRVAKTGKMTFSLNNGENNSKSTLGLYSPGHANAEAGFEIGTPVALKFVYDDEVTQKFYGTIREINPIAGKHGKRTTKVTVVDFMADMAMHKMNLLAVSTNQRSDQVASAILGNMTKQPYAESIATGQSTFTYTGDGLKDEKTTALAAMQRVVISELGYAYDIGGTFTFEDRNTRTGNDVIEATFTEDELQDIVPVRSDKNLFNRVEAKTYPRNVGAANEILYSLPTRPDIGPSETETIIARYRDPSQESARISGTTMVEPLKDTDYKFGSTEGAGVNDMNNDLGVVVTFGANSAKLVLTNNAAGAGYLNLMQLRGLAIRMFDPATALAFDSTSELAYGTRPLPINMLYQDSPLEGQDFADILLSRWKDPRTLPKTMGFWANQDATRMANMLSIEPASRIAVSESLSAVADDYFVNGVEVEISSTKMVYCRWFIVPAATSAFWFLGIVTQSECGETTYWGF